MNILVLVLFYDKKCFKKILLIKNGKFTFIDEFCLTFGIVKVYLYKNKNDKWEERKKVTKNKS